MPAKKSRKEHLTSCCGISGRWLHGGKFKCYLEISEPAKIATQKQMSYIHFQDLSHCLFCHKVTLRLDPEPVNLRVGGPMLPKEH